eukprot:TRINITY_DN8280_c0_g2_i1.p1 TRINITY_DN8280_c0_g2~~TRINITY_DN8280_c0_g2_i1.p1  ORF type:complete len:412 (-),score=40.15 TRINITY_DN8280_c0_g2_i1:753-1988(-)
MGNEVYANMREVSCKSADGKSICAFPDVCMTPPENPATPPGVPVPYPNTGMASDTTKGTRKVKITKKEAMIKNKSYFKKSMGDEAGCAAKKGVITSTNRGKVYFTSWSMDVKFEGSNVVRMADLTTHNHMSVPGNTPPWPYVDGMDVDIPFPEDHDCAADAKKEKEACADKGFGRNVGNGSCVGGSDPCADIATAKPGTRADAMDMSRRTMAQDCLKARKCMLVPYEPRSNEGACCPGHTGHHIVEAGSFFTVGRGGTSSANKRIKTSTQNTNYKAGKAPCVCVSGKNQYHGSHGLMHSIQGNSNRTTGAIASVDIMDDEGKPKGQASLATNSYAQARKNGLDAMAEVFPESGCEEKCLQAQLDAYHKTEVGVGEDDEIRSIVTGYTKDEQADNSRAIVKEGRTRSDIRLP